MSASTSTLPNSTPTTTTWIDLRDRQSSAQLRIDRVGASLEQFLFIIGLSHNSPKWARAIKELGFVASPNNRFLLRRIEEGERIKVATFQKIWPDATYAQMSREKVGLNLANKVNADKGRAGVQAGYTRDIENELANAKLLGRNFDGHSVYQSGRGRFIYNHENGHIQEETKGAKASLYLRAHDQQSQMECADGFVRAMLMGEVLRSDDLDRFVQAVFDTDQCTPEQLEVAYQLVDAAMVRRLVQTYETANDAYGEAVRLYEYMPAYRGAQRGGAAMPIPLSILVQRLLGDTTGKVVTIPNAFDGACFAFLTKTPDCSIQAFKGSRDIWLNAAYLGERNVRWGDTFRPAHHINAQAMIFNADAPADGVRSDYKAARLAVHSTADSARSILILEGDHASQPGVVSVTSSQFLLDLSLRYTVEDVFDVAREIVKGSGARSTLRVISLTNRTPTAIDGQLPEIPSVLPVCHTWDQVKARVDEVLAHSKLRERQSEGIDVQDAIGVNPLQRPYIAFSAVGEARTMVPKDLQQPLHECLSEIEAQHGSVDEFVCRELHFAGMDTLAERFSPEQVDALAMIIHRMRKGRGHILGDETGIGKGRTIAGLMTWALKQDRPVVFVTDRANLFSDIARDLRDIGEWGRVRPLIMNTDGTIVDNIGDAGVLAEGVKASEMRRMLEDNIPLAETHANVVFTTYSQLSGTNSAKATWLKNQLRDALLIVDEAHIASGSDSNISSQIVEMTQIAWNVQYSSATWAKSSKNLHIFARAMPESINCGTLANTMRQGGEAFAEVFSSMMARDGALIRREHDLSKLEFVVEVDKANEERNNAVADQVAEIMSALAFTGGAVQRIITRLSKVNIAALREARNVLGGARTAKVFSSRFGTGSMLYQVSRRLNAALNVDNAVRLALQGLEAGRKPVIVFEDTGEAFIRQAMQEQAQQMPDGSMVLPELLRAPTIKDLLRRVVQTLQMVRVEDVSAEDLPELDEPVQNDAAVEEEETAAVRTELNPDVEVVSTPQESGAAAALDEGIGVAEVVQTLAGPVQNQDTNVADEEREPVQLRGNRRRKYKLVPFWEITLLQDNDRKLFDDGMSEIYALIDDLPDIKLNAPDEMSRRLNAARTASGDRIRVGELSGRTFALQPHPDVPDRFAIIQRPKSKAYVNATVRAFNSGEIDVLMMNRSAATGLSVHASPRFADRRRRQLIEMQIPENPTDRLQLYGRVNRYDQVSFPLIQVASTGIYGEVRHIMVQNKKLAEMSANVRSSRDSHALVKDVRDLLNPVGNEVCRQFLDDNPELVMRLDLGAVDLEAGADLASRFTARIPLLRVDEQKQVYEQLYTMFDDAAIQAELAGGGAFRPQDMDVRAAIGQKTVLMGIDHQGIGSAFDGPVFAQRISWVESFKPMSAQAIYEVIRVNREKLIQAGIVKLTGYTTGNVPTIEMGDVVNKLVIQTEGRARMAVAGTSFSGVAEALASPQPNPVRKGMARAAWFRENLGKIIPGRIVHLSIDDPFSVNGYKTMVILDVVPASEKRLSQLAQWRVQLLSPGAPKPIQLSLKTLVGNLATSMENPAELLVMSRSLSIEADFVESHENSGSAPLDYALFTHQWAASRHKDAFMLTGNMYLASEWAAHTKSGKGVTFTDDQGLRHRAIRIKDSMSGMTLMHLPVRIWGRAMVTRFFDMLHEEQEQQRRGATDDAIVLYSSFQSACRNSTAERHADRIVVKFGEGIVMHVGKESVKRVQHMLSQTQSRIKKELFQNTRRVNAEDDPGHVGIGRRNRGSSAGATDATQSRARNQAILAGGVASAHAIQLQADNQHKIQRAVRMLIEGPGLEVYVPAESPYYHSAQKCVQGYFIERLSQEVGDDPVRMAKLDEFLANIAPDLRPEGVTLQNACDAHRRLMAQQ